MKKIFIYLSFLISFCGCDLKNNGIEINYSSKTTKKPLKLIVEEYTSNQYREFSGSYFFMDGFWYTDKFIYYPDWGLFRKIDSDNLLVFDKFFMKSSETCWIADFYFNLCELDSNTLHLKTIDDRSLPGRIDNTKNNNITQQANDPEHELIKIYYDISLRDTLKTFKDKFFAVTQYKTYDSNFNLIKIKLVSDVLNDEYIIDSLDYVKLREYRKDVIPMFR